MEKILDIKDLTIHFEMKSGVVKAVNHVSFTLNKGKPWVWWAKPAPERRPQPWGLWIWCRHRRDGS